VAMAGLAAFSVYGFFGKLKLFPRAFILFHILHVVLAVATLIL
jgi:hypothetical protein